MTVPPEDQPALWLKQVPNNQIAAEGVWSQRLLPGHHTVARSRERPTAIVDAVALQELKIAADELVLLLNDMSVEEVRRLKCAVQDMNRQQRR